MYILLRHLDGRLQEAVLLSLRHDSMRVSIPGETDAVAFTLLDGQWFSDDGGLVEFEFMAATAEDEWNRLCEQWLFQAEVDEWAAKPLPLGCIPTPAAAGRMWN